MSNTQTIEREVPGWFFDPERNCPSWCDSGHAQACHEFDDLAAAAVHMSADFSHYLPTMTRAGNVEREGGGRWDVHLVMTPRDVMTNPLGLSLVRVRLDEDYGAGHGHVELDLSTGEARTLAAQLLALADKADLS